MSGLRFIELEGVRVNNLRNVSLKIRHNALTVICGVSGSGKSSLAFDTLYAEGQRRYVETFSPSARQFLDRVERPAADRIVGLPPAIAIRQQMRADGPRQTLGTRTEVIDALRILFARAGTLVCPDCGVSAEAASPESAAAMVLSRCENARVVIAATVSVSDGEGSLRIAELIRQGFTRAIVEERTTRLEDLSVADLPASFLVVIDRIKIDRIKADSTTEPRLAEAIGSAMQLFGGDCCVLVDRSLVDRANEQLISEIRIDDANWTQIRFSSQRTCGSCRRRFSQPSPESLSFTSPLGACVTCEGTGVIASNLGRLNAGRTKRGVARSSAVESPCPECRGHRLNKEAVAVRLGDCSLPDVAAMEIGDLISWLSATQRRLSASLQIGLKSAFEHATRRLQFLSDCGLSYLSLDRSMKTLSGGEAQRAMLTTALGSGLISTLYVLDEPTAGLHSSDTQKIIAAVRSLQHQGNTVVIVEHDPDFILAADDVIEIGPGAGDDGGTVVFQGTPAELISANSLTGRKLKQSQDRLATRGESERAEGVARPKQSPEHWLDLTGVRSHNIQNINVRIPLGVFCAVTGVSGSGKSSLIADALYPALCRQLGIDCNTAAEGTIDRIDGAAQIENVVLLDQSPVLRSRRSIPATWIGVFDEIRILLAETHEAKKRNYSRAMFSFNAASGGRCPVCEGRGVVSVAMQFLADIQTTCEECQGRRFRPEVIEIRYRDRSVYDILTMTADEAFAFFNGHHRIQQRLSAVRQIGLGYLRLGQPLNTISGGEAQRLRVAALLAGVPISDGDTSAENRKASKLTQAGRTLFLLDEPSSGLHLQDIDRLLSCIDFLLQTGHSVVVIDHDRSLVSQADWRIEMGPGSGKLGGEVVRSESGF